MKKLFTAIKTNPDVRKKVLVATGITVAAVAAGVVLATLKDNTENVLVLVEGAETLTDAAITE